MRILLTTLNAKYIHSSLALRYLRAYAQTKGVDCGMEEYTINMPVQDIVGGIMEESPTVVGFACYIWNIEQTLHVARMLKAVKPSLTIILGGPEVSYTARVLMEEHPYIDYVVQGEGEECLTSLLLKLQHGGTEQIDGILERTEEGLSGSEEVVEVKDLGTIPFPYTQDDLANLEHKIIYYESSRGCPFSCQYCLSGNRNTVRFFPQERTLQELQWFVERGVKQVKFVDRTFNCAKHHHLPLMRFIKDCDTQTNFHMEMEADLIGEEEVALLTTAAKGRMQIEVGVQSTNEKTLAAIRRYNNWEYMKKVLQPIIDAGRTHVHMDLIVGLPYEDYAQFQQSFDDVFRLAPQALQIGFLKMLKGAGIRSMPEHEYVFDYYAPYEVLANAYLSYEEVRFLKVFEDVFERYYNSGKFMHLFSFLGTRWQDAKGSPFKAFERLTTAWRQLGYHKIKLNDKTQALFLYHHVHELWHEDEAVMKDLLKLDILLAYEGKLKPEEMGFGMQTAEERKISEAFWRDEDAVRVHLPNYSFKEWTAIRRRYQELSLSSDTQAYLQTATRTLIVDVTGEVPPFAEPETRDNAVLR